MGIRAQQQMTKFVGHHTTQDDGELELGVIPLGAPQRKLVIHTGENGMDSKTKDAILGLVQNGCGEYAHPDVGSPKCFPA